MSSTPYSKLDTVGAQISTKLREEIQQLVDAKYDVDELACHSLAGRRLTEPFHDGAYGPRIGTSFFRTVFPFSDLEPCGDAFSALVPVSQTIGASWRWTTSSVPENERPALLASFQDPIRATSEGYERAEFVWIKPLGLFLAHEGKNRVGFFRDMGAQWIPAHVAPYDYPAADRLAIYAATHAHKTVYWAVLDGRLLEPIDHPDWTLPVLRAYGVQEHHRWPHEFPAVDVVIAALTARLVNPVSGRQAPLDLRLVREKEEYESEEIPCSLLDIGALSAPWLFLAVMFSVSIVAIMLVGIMPADWSNLRIAAGIAAGLGFGGLLTPGVRLVRVPRRLADPDASLRKFSPLERKAAGTR
ncbi:hypothetical protein BamIOP4010DRAFT_0647 [Burkholderia ambifaria IOP40-10]|uniref:Transmembrane protein n=1 Tax=Burkholderia ambifaria IOP40-10 TaxID=396596 RepID=B1F9D8_9BURK|nr:hypothetical protein [Burkholderia ambifaria]EDT05910.1 hypothetical protein BamIOP4010DRAFT_0647 [Burkholderia ambifaria IOP40-10]